MDFPVANSYLAQLVSGTSLQNISGTGVHMTLFAYFRIDKEIAPVTTFNLKFINLRIQITILVRIRNNLTQTWSN